MKMSGLTDRPLLLTQALCSGVRRKILPRVDKFLRIGKSMKEGHFLGKATFFCVKADL